MRFIIAFAFLILSIQVQAQLDSIIPISEADRMPDTNEPQEEEPIFMICEVMPEFPGGEEAMNNFLAQNMQYPAAAKDANIQGTVFLQLIIEKDGCVNKEKINVLRGVQTELDNEALRVAKLMPCWSAGTQRERPVRVHYNLPVRFVLK
ncbi:energy transducer TonB [bacterium]|nr:energy transducer TonB [bacterium]